MLTVASEEKAHMPHLLFLFLFRLNIGNNQTIQKLSFKVFSDRKNPLHISTSYIDSAFELPLWSGLNTCSMQSLRGLNWGFVSRCLFNSLSIISAFDICFYAGPSACHRCLFSMRRWKQNSFQSDSCFFNHFRLTKTCYYYYIVYIDKSSIACSHSSYFWQYFTQKPCVFESTLDYCYYDN